MLCGRKPSRDMRCGTGAWAGMLYVTDLRVLLALTEARMPIDLVYRRGVLEISGVCTRAPPTC